MHLGRNNYVHKYHIEMLTMLHPVDRQLKNGKTCARNLYYFRLKCSPLQLLPSLVSEVLNTGCHFHPLSEVLPLLLDRMLVHHMLFIPSAGNMLPFLSDSSSIHWFTLIFCNSVIERSAIFQ